MNSQVVPENATNIFYSQDNPHLLLVDIPQSQNGTSTLMYAPVDVSPNVMNSSEAKGMAHSYTHQTGKGSRVQNVSINPTGNSVPKPPRYTPSHPVSKVSSPSVIKIEQPSNVYPSSFIYYLQELANLVAIVPSGNASTGLNKVVGYTLVPINRGQTVPLKTLSENTNNACLELDSGVEHLHEISHIPAERKSKYPTKYAKGNEQYEQSLKHLNPDGKTGVSSNSAEVSTFQSSKCVDKRRQDRYSIYEKTSKYQDKTTKYQEKATKCQENATKYHEKTSKYQEKPLKYHEKVAVLSDQQKRNSSGEKANFCLPVQLSKQYPVSKDADTSSVHTKYTPAISKEEGKGKRKDKKSSQPATRSNESGEGESEALEKYKSAVLVYFDLETGGLYNGVDILQIAAVSNGRSFMQYVTPTRHISAVVQDINGLKNKNGTLMKKTSRISLTWEPLETLPIEKSLKKFLDWLDATGPCFLVAHNASFDKRHLLYQVNMAGLYSEFQKRVFGFIDTLPFFRAMYPELKKPGPGHRQVVLVKHVLQETYDAHDALEDVKSLQKLVKKVDAPLTDLLKHKLDF